MLYDLEAGDHVFEHALLALGLTLMLDLLIPTKIQHHSDPLRVSGRLTNQISCLHKILRQRGRMIYSRLCLRQVVEGVLLLRAQFGVSV